jgi:hypothetical protein
VGAKLRLEEAKVSKGRKVEKVRTEGSAERNVGENRAPSWPEAAAKLAWG